MVMIVAALVVVVMVVVPAVSGYFECPWGEAGGKEKVADKDWPSRYADRLRQDEGEVAAEALKVSTLRSGLDHN